jgi:acetyl-CoA C-acetyltransferase
MPHSTYPRRTPDDVVIVGGARTPQGRINGQFASFSASDLGARALAGRTSSTAPRPDDACRISLTTTSSRTCEGQPAPPLSTHAISREARQRCGARLHSRP